MATLEDVARQAGVSLATASRVLNGSSRKVGEALQRRVEEAAAELGYETDVTAQALARGSTNVVGLIVHDLTDPYFAALADGAMRAADRHGFIVTVGTTYRDPEREIAFVATMRAQRVRAIVLAGSRIDDPERTGRLRAEIARFGDSGGRVATIGQDLLAVNTVAPANRAGAAALARALAALGHRRFAILAGPPDLVTAADRTAGFAAALAEQGLPEPRIVPGSFDHDGGQAAAAELLPRPNVTCVFAVNDVMALGALAALRDASMDVPGKLSVAGFDDISTLRDVVPGLTTVRLPLTAMGEQAVELALGHFGDGPVTARVEGEVVLRASTGRI